jgi:metallophosphoesterase (TIGR00282 family)
LTIFAIGDVIGDFGCKFLKSNLNLIREKEKIDLIIANGENSSSGNGMTAASSEYLLNCGVDVITGGNHTFKRRAFFNYLEKSVRIVRPANYPEGTPGKGFLKFKFNNIKFCVINLVGTVYLEPVSCPFRTLDEILKKTSDCIIKIVDFHAEATSEKRALGFYADGRVSVIFGTHTHVQTSDEEILPRGTGYITDVGMTGAANSVLGLKPEISIKRMKEKIPIKYEHENHDPCKIEGAIFFIEENKGKTVKIKRIRII